MSYEAPDPLRPAISVVGAIGAVAVFVSLFLDWFKAEAAGDEVSLTGFGSFETADLLLTLLALGAIAIAVQALLAMVNRRPASLDNRLLLPIGALAFLIVVFQLFKEPPVFSFFSAAQPELDVTPSVGAWVAFGGSLGILLAGVLEVAQPGTARSRTYD